MANHKSAEKRHRQSLKRRDRNRERKTELKSAVKQTRQAIEKGDSAGARKAFQVAEKLLAKAAAKGLVHRRNASRRIGRLGSLVSGLGK